MLLIPDPQPPFRVEKEKDEKLNPSTSAAFSSKGLSVDTILGRWPVLKVQLPTRESEESSRGRGGDRGERERERTDTEFGHVHHRPPGGTFMDQSGRPGP